MVDDVVMRIVRREHRGGVRYGGELLFFPPETDFSLVVVSNVT